MLRGTGPATGARVCGGSCSLVTSGRTRSFKITFAFFLEMVETELENQTEPSMRGVYTDSYQSHWYEYPLVRPCR